MTLYYFICIKTPWLGLSTRLTAAGWNTAQAHRRQMTIAERAAENRDCAVHIRHLKSGVECSMGNGLKTRAECLEQYGSDYRIQQAIQEGKLFRVGRGIFSEKPNVPDLVVLCFQYPNAILTMHSAFYLYHLTDEIQDKYDLATDRNSAKIPDPRVHQYFYPSDFFRDGVETMDYHGYAISIYSRERMLIELLRYKSKLPFDQYKEILLNYRRIFPSLDMQQIQYLALAAPKRDKIMERLQLEVL